MEKKGPRGSSLVFGAGPEFKKDPLEFLRKTAAEYPKFASFRFGHRPMHLLSDETYFAHVLQKNYKNYRKGLKSRELQHFLGDSIAISEGEYWRANRKIVQPAFGPEKIANMAQTVLDCTLEYVEKWKSRTVDSPELEMVHEMKVLTLNIAGKTLFGVDFDSKSERMTKAVTFLIDHVNTRIRKAYEVPMWFPGGERPQFKQERAYLDEIIYEMIRERRANGNENHMDLLSMLMEAQDEDGNIALTDEEIRNEIITMFLTGTESSAVVISWLIYLISLSPERSEVLRNEIEQVSGSHELTIQHIRQLKQPRAYIHEALRLYPPVWVVSRQAIEDDEIEDLIIKKGDGVLISPYSLHRSPLFWDNPDIFNPQRFLDNEEELSRSKNYIPFGLGPRLCVGDQFALLETQIILSVLYKQFSFEYTGGFDLKVEIGFNIRPQGGIKVKPTPLR